MSKNEIFRNNFQILFLEVKGIKDVVPKHNRNYYYYGRKLFSYFLPNL